MSKPSFNAINYSLRPSKTIQRAIIFEELRRLSGILQWKNPLYLGFGSIWFTDFILAHKILKINKMISIEGNEIGFRRAKFNKPYRFVELIEGLSYEIIPNLLDDQVRTNCPWVIWLDYDQALAEDQIEELKGLVENAPSNSILLTTFDGTEKKYGSNAGVERINRVRQLFGSLVPENLSNKDLKGSAVAKILGDLLSKRLVSTAINCGRDGGAVPAFSMCYKDKASMVTVGIVLCSASYSDAVKKCVRSPDWMGNPVNMIAAPHLTAKEVSVLQAQLPRKTKLTRASIQRVGFDLEEEQIDVFQDYYQYYPNFAQINS